MEGTKYPSSLWLPISGRKWGAKRKGRNGRACNLCGQIFRARGAFERFCRRCREEREELRFEGWLPELDQREWEKFSA
jgi:hypothetical protein